MHRNLEVFTTRKLTLRVASNYYVGLSGELHLANGEIARSVPHLYRLLVLVALRPLKAGAVEHLSPVLQQHLICVAIPSPTI